MKRLVNDRQGVTSLEYALICALIFLVIIVAVQAYAGNVSIMYNNFSSAIGATM